ncbi:MAG: hypothetical protein AVDCRST_MAG07-384 [uncultured Frankineae bacterium]|uniref:Uncharacterized protein n=1 Tax=uncultured Frankineae bacterium TaxID=437475 RepID=A0A6J4KLW8_9ACTN|nr:MAG: hypothetical protein AVDCRST_MAG07-384 [uncultured Frankineae bacterium]
MSEQPATSAGTTRAAGEGVDDQELSQQVADQTDSNLEVEGAFEREGEHATTDKEIAQASGDDLV